jgi:hypothetical protein
MQSGGPEIFVEGERYRGTGISAAVDTDGTAEFFGCILYLAKTIGAIAIEIDTGIPDADHGTLADFNRFDMDTFVLRAVDGAVQEVPQDKSQQVFVGTHFNISIYLVDNDSLAAYGTGKKGCR